MAKAKMVAPYEQFIGRDSLKSTPNGSVVFRRSGAPVTRAFSRPVQPNSPIQRTARFLFSGASIAFNALSDADVLTWHNLGLTITRTNAAGFTYHPDARSLFFESYLVGTRNLQLTYTTAPVSVSYNPLLPCTSLTWDPGVTGLGMTYPAVAINQYIILYLTNALSLGVRSLKGRSFHNPALNPVDPSATQIVWILLAAATTSAYFNDNFLRDVLIVGKRYGVRLQTVDPSCNILGPAYDALLTCA